jgi:ADP-heptose:LPS heptosyltransferase
MNKVDQWIRDLNHRRIDFSRSFLLKVFKILFDQRRLLPQADFDAPFLIFRLDDKIGDSVTATGFLKSLKIGYPQKKIIVAAGRTSAQVYRSLDFIDEVIILKKGFVSTLNFFLKMRNDSFASVINTSHILSPRVIFLMRFLKAVQKITFLNSNYRLFSNSIIYDIQKDHVSIRYEKILDVLAIQNKNLDYIFQVPAEALAIAKQKIHEFGYLNKKMILLNPFAGARLRNFAEKVTQEIAHQLLKNENCYVVSIGNQNDLPFLLEWMQKRPHPRWVVFSDQTDFYFNCALVQLADLVITPDTAIVHIASALKKNLVAVYREDIGSEKNSLIWAPYQTNFRQIMAPYDAAFPEDINTFQVKDLIQASDDLLY